MRTMFIRLGVFVSLGAMINIAVAWACAVCISSFNTVSREATDETTLGTQGFWMVSRYSKIGGAHLSWSRIFPESFVHEWEVPSALKDLPGWADCAPTDAERPFAEARHFDARGWPCLSMWCLTSDRLLDMRGLAAGAGTSMNVLPPRGAIETGLSPLQLAGDNPVPRVLPLRPLWLGFFVNTIFYGGLLWLLCSAPFVVRRHLRLKRGHCLACGYPAGASHVCTECGVPASPRVQCA